MINGRPLSSLSAKGCYLKLRIPQKLIGGALATSGE